MASATIGELITTYRLTNTTDRRREDPRHARWWVERIGLDALSTLTTERVVHLLDRLASYGRSPSTVAFYLRFLRRVTAWGAVNGYVSADPCAGMALPKEQTPHLRILTEAEEGALCAALGSPYALWVKLAIATGLKQSEQFTLRWRDIDLERATVLLPHPTTQAVTESSLPPDAIALLRQLRQLQAPSMWVFPDPQNTYRPADVHRFYTGRWTTAVHQAGIPWVAWKDLRHTCGVRMAQAGTPIDAIVRQLRQSENRRAYLYRNWRPDGPPVKRQTHPRQPVFVELDGSRLRELMTRDLVAFPLTVREAAYLYAVHHLRERPSRVQFERCYKNFWAPWGHRPLMSITKKEMLLWYWSLSRTPGHAHKALTLFRGMYSWCLRLDLVTGPNPAVGLPPYPQFPRERFLSVDELCRFMDGLPHLTAKPHAYLLVLLLTAARRSEARTMRWDDVDFALRLWRMGRTKNGRAQFQPLPSQAVYALLQLPRINEWIFPGKDGKPWSAATAEKVWAAIRRRWGLDDVTLHDLRRTCASYLAITGENLPTIQNVLHHRSLGPTSVYARLNVQAVDRALQAQADRFFSAIPSTGLIEQHCQTDMKGGL